MSEVVKKLVDTAAQAAASMNDAEAERLHGIIQGYTIATQNQQGRKESA